MKNRNTRVESFTVSEAANLRRDSREPHVWRRAGMPRLLATSEAMPLAEFPLPGSEGRAVLLAAGRALYASSVENAAADPLAAPRFFLGMLGAEPLEAETSVAGVVKIHCRRSAPEYVTYSAAGDFALRGPLPRLPQMGIRAAAADPRLCDTPVIKLTGATKIASGSAISNLDLSVITPRLLGSYDDLKRSVGNAGAGMQPVLARYRVRDVYGQTVYLSAPVLVCAPSGFQMARGFTLGSGDSMASISRGMVQCDCYHLAVSAPESLPAPWDAIAASAEIELSPQLDPVDAKGLCDGSYQPSGSGAHTATLYYPGIPSVLSARQAALRSMVANALARAGALLRPVSKIGRPFGGTLGAPGSDKYIRMSAGYIGAEELEALPEAPLFVPGATHTARLSADGLSLRANPSRPLPPPAPALALGAALAAAEGSWNGAVSVSLSRGPVPETVVCETAASRSCPLALGPLLVYPDAAATAMTVCIRRPDGSAVARSFPLTPVPQAGLAYWIDPAIARVTLPEAPSGYEVPLESFADSESPGLMEIFDGEADWPVDSARLGSEVVAMAELPRSRSSWDFSRRRVLCFGAAGSEMLTIGSDGRLRSTAVVDRRPVRSPEAVARAGGSDGAALLVVAGDDLLRISGSRIETLLARCGAARPGWCPPWNEIWLFGVSPPGAGLEPGGESSPSPLRLLSDGTLVGADLPGIDSSATCRLWRGRLLIGCYGSLYDASAEEDAGSLPFRLSLDATIGVRPKALTARVFAAEITGSLSLSGHDGSEVFGSLGRFRVSGPLNGPLRLPLVALVRRYLRLTVSGSASPDLAIRGLSLEVYPSSPREAVLWSERKRAASQRHPPI